VDRHLQSRDGIFSGVSDEVLIFHIDNQQTTFQKENVLRVSSRGHIGRGQKALVGLGIGLAAGAVAGAAMGAKENDFLGSGGMAVLMAIPFGAIGAVVGGALPAGHPIIYLADPSSGISRPSREVEGLARRYMT
jgi:hypothetical protein